MFTDQQIAAKRAAVVVVAGVDPSDVSVDDLGNAFVKGKPYKQHTPYVLCLKALIMQHLFGFDSNVTDELPKQMPHVAKALFSGHVLFAGCAVARALYSDDIRAA